jgi:hypothetical protein
MATQQHVVVEGHSEIPATYASTLVVAQENSSESIILLALPQRQQPETTAGGFWPSSSAVELIELCKQQQQLNRSPSPQPVPPPSTEGLLLKQTLPQSSQSQTASIIPLLPDSSSSATVDELLRRRGQLLDQPKLQQSSPTVAESTMTPLAAAEEPASSFVQSAPAAAPSPQPLTQIPGESEDSSTTFPTATKIAATMDAFTTPLPAAALATTCDTPAINKTPRPPPPIIPVCAKNKTSLFHFH